MTARLKARFGESRHRDFYHEEGDMDLKMPRFADKAEGKLGKPVIVMKAAIMRRCSGMLPDAGAGFTPA